jgi:RNA polymerase sigma factor (sigma-70 family)
MATSQMTDIIQHVRRVVLLADGAGLTDGQLLECFISRREEAALAALVRRHSPMVWGVCRRVLFNHHDAEDAFQATFLVLVRRAASIMPRDMVANWLYGVAYQTALKARGTVARRMRRERQVVVMPETDAEAVQPDRCHELRYLLDQELSSLPDKHRAVIVLCDLEEKTRSEAARQLGVPEGTVASRLARARTILGKRLARQGVVMSSAALAGALSQNVTSASVPTWIVSSTIKLATLSAAGQATGGLISAKVAALTERVLKTLLLTKRNVATALLLAVGLVGAGAGTLPWPYLQATQKHTGQDSLPVQQKSHVRQPALDGQVAMDTPEMRDACFREAVSAIDAGDVDALEHLLAAHPELVRERLDAPGDWLRAKVGSALEGYFRQPYLLWFVAENPVRNDKLPKNIAQVTRLMVQAAQRERVNSLQAQLDYTLELLVTGRVAREWDLQLELIDLLIDAGASPDATQGALAYGNLAAAERLLEHGAKLTLAAALCLGRTQDGVCLAQVASDEDRQLALAAAALNGKVQALATVIDLGVDLDAYSSGIHTHATALHHAVDSGSLDAVKVLVAAGAELGTRDRIHQGTPLDWAEYLQGEAKREDGVKQYAEIAAYLREKELQR